MTEFTITKDIDLRVAYSLARFMEDTLEQFKAEGVHPSELRYWRSHKRYVELLRAIRKYTNDEPEIKRDIFAQSIDEYYEKITFPKGWTPSRARIYFAQHIYIDYPEPSMYDCTGECWTDWIHTVVLHGQVVIYHHVQFDL